MRPLMKRRLIAGKRFYTRRHWLKGSIRSGKHPRLAAVQLCRYKSCTTTTFEHYWWWELRIKPRETAPGDYSIAHSSESSVHGSTDHCLLYKTCSVVLAADLREGKRLVTCIILICLPSTRWKLPRHTSHLELLSSSSDINNIYIYITYIDNGMVAKFQQHHISRTGMFAYQSVTLNDKRQIWNCWRLPGRASYTACVLIPVSSLCNGYCCFCEVPQPQAAFGMHIDKTAPTEPKKTLYVMGAEI